MANDSEIEFKLTLANAAKQMQMTEENVLKWILLFKIPVDTSSNVIKISKAEVDFFCEKLKTDPAPDKAPAPFEPSHSQPERIIPREPLFWNLIDRARCLGRSDVPEAKHAAFDMFDGICEDFGINQN